MISHCRHKAVYSGGLYTDQDRTPRSDGVVALQGQRLKFLRLRAFLNLRVLG